MKASPKANLKRFIEPPDLRLYSQTRFGLALIAAAERACVLRDDRELSRIAGIMCRERTPAALRQIGQYYQGLSLLRGGLAKSAVQSLESVTENGAPVYQAKARIALGSIQHKLGNARQALENYRAAARISSDVDWVSYWQAEKMRAVILSGEGDHRGALRQLQRIAPLVRYLGQRYPLTTYDHLNSIALELAENNEQSRAIAIAETMSAWPILDIYPEFEETRRTLLRLRHSKSRLFLHRDAVQEQNDAMAAPQPDRLLEVTPGKLLPFERPQKQTEGTAVLIAIGDYSTPWYKGPLSDKNLKRLFRLLDSF